MVFHGAESLAGTELLVPAADLEDDLMTRINLGHELLTTVTSILSRTDWKDRGLDQKDEVLVNATFTKYQIWNEVNEALLRRSFSTSGPLQEYTKVPFYIRDPDHPLLEPVARINDREVLNFHQALKRRIERLEFIAGLVPFFSQARGPAGPMEYEKSNVASKRDPRGGSIFIVHGHKDATKEQVARYLTRLTGVDPVILHEQPNAGRTVIEKFEDYAASIIFAVILLTADDEGRALSSPTLNPRARQNVILELGFFIGTLGRSHVAVLHEKGVELPSDISGLLYTSLDAEWRLDLAKELNAAGVPVDMNKVL